MSRVSSWDRCLIDCTINLILWDKPLCILPPMSNKGWTAIYHWIWPITPPFTAVPTEGAVCSPPVCMRPGEERGGLSPSLPGQGWHGPGAGAAFVRQTGFGTSRWSSLLQNAPQLMEWDTTVTTWPSKAPLNSPAVFPCVIYGSVGRPNTAISCPYLKHLICAVVFVFTGLDVFILF